MNQAEALRERTKQFAIRVIYLFRALPRSIEAQVLGKQLLRSATSVAANYRAVCRARSKSEFIARVGVVAEEAEESALWIELMAETGVVKPKRLQAILTEAHELTAIFSASQKTAKSNR